MGLLHFRKPSGHFPDQTRTLAGQVSVCVFGGSTDAQGICLEHGESACVMTLGVPVAAGVNQTHDYVRGGAEPGELPRQRIPA